LAQLGGFGSVRERNHSRGCFGSKAGRARGTIFGLLRGFQAGRGSRGIVFVGGFVYFGDSVNVLVRDFPTEIIEAAALLNVLFEENGAAGIAYESARSRQHNVTNAIADGHSTAEKF
jgi:hypothetical protein